MFIRELKRRNRLLYSYTIVCVLGFVVCLLLSLVTNIQVAGINAMIKPAKFFLSIAVFSATMGWFMEYLVQKRKVFVYSIVLVTTLTIELVIITSQAASGKLSHFNISTRFDGILFQVMGIVITVVVLWTAYIGWLFFKQQKFDQPLHYIWAIKLGLIFFVIFSFEGGMMASQLAHTVGSADGGPGLPFVNWSRNNGDLRIAHFLGMHALQLLPLFAYYILKTRRAVNVFALAYLLIVTSLFILALKGKPLIPDLSIKTAAYETLVFS